MAPTTLGPTAAAIGVQGGRCAGGHEEAIEVEAVIWIGIAAIIVIAAVIAAIGRPGGGRGSGSRSVGSGNARRRVGSYSGAGGYSGAYGAGAWGGDSGSGSCGDSSAGGFSGGDCGGGGGSF